MQVHRFCSQDKATTIFEKQSHETSMETVRDDCTAAVIEIFALIDTVSRSCSRLTSRKTTYEMCTISMVHLYSKLYLSNSLMRAAQLLLLISYKCDRHLHFSLRRRGASYICMLHCSWNECALLSQTGVKGERCL